MAQATRVLSTPPLNTPISQVDATSRRRFLSQAAGVAAGGAVLALATVSPQPAVAAPTGALDPASASPALHDAVCALDDAGEAWKTAKAAYVAEDLKAYEWRQANPEPKDRRAKKKYGARWRKNRDQSSILAKWEAQLAAEDAFSAALIAVARIAPRDMAELAIKASLTVVYEDGDFLELLRGNSAPIARSVAFSLIKMTLAVSS
jgi:hypothetical protein